MEKTRWVTPHNTCKADSWEEVAKRFAALLTSMENISRSAVYGQVIADMNNFFYKVKDTLIQEGWEVSWITETSMKHYNRTKIKVKPPKEKDRVS